jgi:hypothetical protein
VVFTLKWGAAVNLNISSGRVRMRVSAWMGERLFARPTEAQRAVFAKCVPAEGARLSIAVANTAPSNRARANVQPASTAKEERSELVCHSLRGNVPQSSRRPV